MRFANSSCLPLPGVREGGALGKKAAAPGARREENVAFVPSVCHSECDGTLKSSKWVRCWSPSCCRSAGLLSPRRWEVCGYLGLGWESHLFTE